MGDSFNLSDEIKDFDYILIVYTIDNIRGTSITPSGTSTIALSCATLINNNTHYTIIDTINIEGKKFTLHNARAVENGGSTNHITYLKVYRIIGIRRHD